MKIKLLLGTLVCVCMLLFAFANTSFALGYAQGRCTIDSLGAAATYNFCFVTCPDAGYNNQWFRVDNANRRELLATLLTAFSNGNEVRIHFKDASTIDRVWVMD